MIKAQTKKQERDISPSTTYHHHCYYLSIYSHIHTYTTIHHHDLSKDTKETISSGWMGLLMPNACCLWLRM
jgi:hypothetical protein